MSTTNLTAEQVLAMAPDASAAKAGEGLSRAAQWLSIGHNQATQTIWGQLQGSGSKPYQSKVALGDYTTSCSCPSRKFPCKHALGLLLIWVREPAAVVAGEPPAFVAEWLEKRGERAEKKAEKLAAVAVPLTPEALAKVVQQSAKRDVSRNNRQAEGIAELKTWLADIAQEGLAASNIRLPDAWRQRARRLVDAQLPGLARVVDQLGDGASRDDWLATLTEGVGRLALAITAFERQAVLSRAELADLQRFLGQPQRETDIEPDAVEQGTWQAVGECVEEDERIRARRVWLLPSAGLAGSAESPELAAISTAQRLLQAAVHVSFSVGAQPFAPGPLADARYALPLQFYPGAARPLSGKPGRTTGLRAHLAVGEWSALPRPNHPTATFERLPLPAGLRIHPALDQVAAALARDPWAERWPLLLHARLALAHNQWWLIDDTGAALPATLRAGVGIAARGAVGTQAEGGAHPGFQWLIATQGLPCNWFGEWSGEQLLILAADLPLSGEASQPFPFSEPADPHTAATIAPLSWPKAQPFAPFVLGTAKPGAETHALPFKRGLAVNSAAELTPATALLQQLAALSLGQRAGPVPAQMSPAQAPLYAVRPLPACVRALAPPRAQTLLRQRVLAGQQALVADALALLAAKRLRVAPRSLPLLLDYCATAQRRAWFTPVACELTAWLVAYNADWQYALADLSLDSPAAPSLAELQAAFETAIGKPRQQVFAALRAADAAAARDTIAPGFSKEKAEDRLAFLQTFAAQLSMADEPLIEGLLDDRKKELRDTAADYLARLPESRFVQRAITRAAPLLRYEPALLHKGLQVVLPEAPSKACERDGIEAKPNPGYGMGVKQGWLVAALARVPISHWLTQFQLDRAALCAAACAHPEFALPLVLALTKAAAAQSDGAMLLVLTEAVLGKQAQADWQSLLAHEIAPSLGAVPNLGVRVVLPLLQSVQAGQQLLTLSRLLSVVPTPWPEPLSDGFIAWARAASAKFDATSVNAFYHQELLRRSAYAISPKAEYLTGWTELTEQGSSFAIEFINTLSQRIDFVRALAGLPEPPHWRST